MARTSELTLHGLLELAQVVSHGEPPLINSSPFGQYMELASSQ